MKIESMTPKQITEATKAAFPNGLVDTFRFIAAVASDVNAVYSGLANTNEPPKPPFEECSDEHKNSMFRGVLLHWQNPHVSPQENHDKWLEQKKKDGWTYGPAFDSVRKEHPAMLPFAELPIETQVKNMIFPSVVKALFRLLVVAEIEKAAHELFSAPKIIVPTVQG